MAAIVCHGLPSCLDSHLIESRIHNIRLPSPKPLTTQPIDLPFKTCFWESNNKPHFENNINKTETVDSNPKEDGWSSIQSLSKSNASKGLKETTYVHPNVKLPWHRLSPKSLELCTENLGNETGADIPEFSIDLLSSTNSSACGNSETEEQKKNSCQNLGGEKMRTKSFPPPLKSMRGSESLRVKPRRENGRLVIELTKVPSTVSCFQAERSNGRLRLSYWNDPEEDENQGFEEVENSTVVVAPDAPPVSLTKEEFKTNMNVEDQEEEVNDEEVVEEGTIDNEKEEGETPTHVGGCIESKENGWKIGSEVMRMENQKYERGSRRRRCKEGKHESNERLGNWSEHLWLALATS